MTVIQCPRCNDPVRIPSFRAPEGSFAKCSWCGETFPLDEAIARLPPALEIIGPDGETVLPPITPPDPLDSGTYPSGSDAGAALDDSVERDSWHGDNASSGTVAQAASSLQLAAGGESNVATEVRDGGGPAWPVREVDANGEPMALLAEPDVESNQDTVVDDDRFDSPGEQSELEEDWEVSTHSGQIEPVLRPAKVNPKTDQAPGAAIRTSRPQARKQAGSPVMAIAKVALGGLLALPIAGGILQLVGRPLPIDLGFWPFTGPGTPAASSGTRAAAPLPINDDRQDDVVDESTSGAMGTVLPTPDVEVSSDSSASEDAIAEITRDAEIVLSDDLNGSTEDSDAFGNASDSPAENTLAIESISSPQQPSSTEEPPSFPEMETPKFNDMATSSAQTIPETASESAFDFPSFDSNDPVDLESAMTSEPSLGLLEEPDGTPVFEPSLDAVPAMQESRNTSVASVPAMYPNSLRSEPAETPEPPTESSAMSYPAEEESSAEMGLPEVFAEPDAITTPEPESVEVASKSISSFVLDDDDKQAINAVNQSLQQAFRSDVSSREGQGRIAIAYKRIAGLVGDLDDQAFQHPAVRKMIASIGGSSVDDIYAKNCYGWFNASQRQSDGILLIGSTTGDGETTFDVGGANDVRIDGGESLQAGRSVVLGRITSSGNTPAISVLVAEPIQ